MIEEDKLLVLKYLFEISNGLENFDFIKRVDEALVHKIKPENVLINDISNIEIDTDRFKEKFSLYYSIACPKFDCDFIFDHPLDHYSFILLMEMGRQMSIGVTHKFKRIPMNQFKNTINRVDFNIHNFAELDFPLVIGCVDKIIKNKPSMQMRELYFFFIQKNNLCAEVSTMISIMSNDLYTRYRHKNRRCVSGCENDILVTNLDMINLKNGNGKE